MSESATEKYLIDPDAWHLLEDAKDIIWLKKHGLKELYDDIIYNFVEELAKELDRKLTKTSTEVEMLIRAKGEPMK